MALYTDYFGDVIHFHIQKNLAISDVPTYPRPSVQDLRVRLIEEETHEVIEAMRMGDLHEIAKELADLLYVTFGTAVTYGIDMDKVWEAVHHSNMTKAAAALIGHGDLKLMRGEDYIAPNIGAIIDDPQPLVHGSEVRT